MPDEITEYAEARAQHPLKQHMLSFLTNGDLMNLSQTSRFFRDFTFAERQKREFNKLIEAAASGEQKDIDVVVAMIKANPLLLLERGDVVTRGGTKIIATTVYEFFLGSGHTEALLAMNNATLFALLPHDGEAERMRQYERYRPHIEQLRDDVGAYVQAYHEAGCSAYRSDYRSAYDLRPLIDVIINTANPADVTAELKQTKEYNSQLRNKMCEFREAINESQRERTEGMHYAHYTTIMQVLHLLVEKWPELSHNNQNHDKCRLVFSQIFGYLELVGLPARERFAFPRAFQDEELSAECKHDPECILPDFDFSASTAAPPVTPSPSSPEVDPAAMANLVRTGLGFSFGIMGASFFNGSQMKAAAGARVLVMPLFLNHMLSKNKTLLELMHTPPSPEIPRSR